MSACLLVSIAQCAAAQDVYTLSDGRNVQTLEMFQECSNCPEMIVLPLGEFRMGGPVGEARYVWVSPEGAEILGVPAPAEFNSDERPLFQVTVDMPIAMGRNEVTRREWMACVDAGGCNGFVPPNHVQHISAELERTDFYLSDDHPVLSISYLNAVAYTEWLNEQVGADVYRIPTEAEWEFAARSGTQTRFAQGDDLTTDQANFNGEGSEQILGIREPRLISRRVPVTVDSLSAANAWGLRHMSGNATEITASCYTERYLGWLTTSEWFEKSVVNGCRRATRGGAYIASMRAARVALRGSAEENNRSTFGGFRVARDLE
ncbi:formylglycine-generating enzyme family protein [Octadecabacter sp. 1_MG-2023]|nr:formylglycine-generating enzyme family protein [Octadecabacter sp. 1_MG-2023]MBU2993984.1 formylglycine-generating enzyme family protein [Octadecabacter sp. B2R22]